MIKPLLLIFEPDERWEAMVALARSGSSTVARRLAVQWLALWPGMDVTGDTIERIRARKADGDDLIALVVAADRLEAMRKALPPANSDSGIESWYKCGWHRLADTDWQWLADQPALREAAARIRAHPLAVLQPDKSLPEDPILRQHALLFLLADASDSESPDRASLARLLAEHLEEIPLAANWGSERPVARQLAERFEPELLLPQAVKAAASSDLGTRRLGLLLLVELSEVLDERFSEAFAKTEGSAALLECLAAACEEAAAQEQWGLLGKSWELVRAIQGKNGALTERIAACAGRSATRAVRHLAQDPRSLPAPVWDAILAIEAATYLDTKVPGAELLLRAHDGDTWFDPDKREPDEPAEPGCAEIWRRFREATAALPKE